MPSTFFGLTIGKSGIYAANAGMNTTAHNIANSETEGYSRQVTETKASSALRVYSSYGMAGTGVDVTGIEQQRDEYYDYKFRKNNTLLGSYETKNYYMTNIENYFNEIELDGFTTTFNNFYNSLQELSKNSTSIATRNQVTNYGQSFCEYFNFLSQSLTSIQEDCNFQIKNEVEQVNSYARRIANLNKQINTLEVNGGTANDLRDTRNLLVDELSKIVNVSFSETIVGDGIGVNRFEVKIDGQVLVDTYEYHTLDVVPRDEKAHQSDADGLYDIVWDTGNKFNIKSPSIGGSIQALFEVRDGNNDEGFKLESGGRVVSDGDDTIIMTGTNVNSVDKLNIPTTGYINVRGNMYKYNGFKITQDEEGNFEYEFDIDTDETPVNFAIDYTEASIGDSIDNKGIPYYMSQLNEFIRTYSREFNEIHTGGEDLNGEKGLDFFNCRHLVTGENYDFSAGNADEDVVFTTGTGRYADDGNSISYYFMTAANCEVNITVFNEPARIAAATSASNGIEDTDNLDKLIALKGDKTMFKQGDPAEFLQSLISDVGVDAAKSEDFAISQNNIVQAITNQRLSISGVDTDEEAMSLMNYQTAYNLSSKVISVMNEIYSKLINEMGL